MNLRNGSITIPKNAVPTDREIIVAGILAQAGKDVTFVPVGVLHSPDIICDGCVWEIKSPEGKSKYTLENNLRHALLQSNNIIMDLQYIGISEKNCIEELKKQAYKSKKIKRLLIITKRKCLLTIK